MWNSEHKSFRSIFTGCACLAVAAALLSLPAGAIGQNVKTGALKAAGGDMQIALEGGYQVTNAALRLNRQKCGVGAGRIVFTPRGGLDAGQSATKIDLKSRSALTALKLKGGRTVKVRTSFLGDRPIVQINLPAVAGELVIELTGADRLAFATTNGFAAHSLARGDRTIVLPAAGAFQNRRSQDGLVLHAASDESAGMHMVRRDGRISVHLATSGEAAIVLTITGFCGDASIACEDVAPAAKYAQSGDAVPAAGGAHPVDVGQPGQPVKFTDEGWLMFTNGDRALAPLLADQREAQIRGGYMVGRDGDTYLDLGFGGDLGLLRRDFSEDESITLTLRGLFTARFQTDADSFPLLNTDYYGGVAFGHRFGKNAWEVYFYHQSAHLGDETLDFGHRARIDYGRESLRFLWSHNFLENLRVYGGPTINVSGSESFVSGKTMVQGGAEYKFKPWNVPMYAAADVQVREQNQWRPSFNGQLGVYIGKTKKINPKPKTRVFLEVFTGYSNMGQYWDVYETSLMLGLGYNW